MTAISKTKATTTIAGRRPNKVNGGWLGTTVLIHGEDATAFDTFAAASARL